jgi:superfamily II DNA or RNA helicase
MRDFPEITDELIHQWLGRTYAGRGKTYFRQHKVVSAETDEADNFIIGVVRGRDVRPYSVLVRLLPGRRMKSKCTCPMRNDCKHVAAVLYKVMEERKQSGLFQAEVGEPMPQAFSQWLGMLEKVKEGKPVAQEYSPGVKQRLLYILELNGDQSIRLSFLSARILKTGGYGKATPYMAANVLNYNTPQFILPADERILREVAMDRTLSSLHGYRIRGEEGLSILKRALTSGRCHWQSKDNAALKRGEKRIGEWMWKLTGAGDQRLTLQMDRGEFIVPTSPPWFIDAKNGECGAVECGQPADVAEILLNVPAIELGCSDEVLQAVSEQLPDGIPAPGRLDHERRYVPPVPVAMLSTIKSRSRWGNYRTPEVCHVVELIFDYEGCETACVRTKAAANLRSIQGDRVVDYVRDMQAEQAAVDTLAAIGLHPMRDDRLAAWFDYSDHAFTLDDAGHWPDWVLHESPYLREQGFRVLADDSFAFKVKRASAWNLDITESGNNLMGRTSFSVRLEDGEEVDLIDALAGWVGRRPELLQEAALAEFRRQESIALPLSDGCILPAPGKMVASILYYMLDMFVAGRSDATLISAPQILALEESLAGLNEPIRISASAWLGRMRQLADIGNVPTCEAPETLRAELRDYQRDGLSWMQFLRQMQLGGILADDMGLGKTVQSLAHMLKEKEEGRLQQPALVVAPTSLMHNWRREAEKFAPGLSLLVLHGPERAQHFARLPEYDVVLTTYPLLVRDFDALSGQPWHMLVLDEAQYIKNPGARVSKLVRRLNATHKICMTGTPMENHLGELWSQFDFLMPGYLYDQKGFTKLFRKPVEIEGDAARQQALNVRIRPFLLRRSKEDVALELPPKTEIIRSIEIEGGQRELYESVRLAMKKKVRDAVASMGMAQSQIIMLDALLKMRQVCCDPRLLGGLQGEPPESAKLQMLMDIVPEMIEEGRRILLFSQFTTMLGLIESALKDRGVDYVKLTGQSKDRITPVERFQNHEVPVFLISLRAGGVGLNLTAADTVIHYDPWWNPAVERQATDRAHRIGQDKAVFVYKLITEGTIEERILAMQARKQALADGIHQHGGVKSPLWSAEDIDLLFTPLS